MIILVTYFRTNYLYEQIFTHTRIDSIGTKYDYGFSNKIQLLRNKL